MKTFKLEIYEMFSKTIEVEAENVDEAKAKAWDVLQETSLSHDFICEDDPDIEYMEDVTFIEESDPNV